MKECIKREQLRSPFGRSSSRNREGIKAEDTGGKIQHVPEVRIRCRGESNVFVPLYSGGGKKVKKTKKT